MRNAILFLIAIAATSLTLSCTSANKYKRLEGYAQGGTFHIIYSAPGGTLAANDDSIMSLVSKRLRDIDFSISGYNRGSLLSRWNRGEDCVPDRYFLELYEMSRRLWEETDGLFDVSGGPLFDFWGFGFKSVGTMDSIRNDARTAHIVDSLKTFVGMDLVSLENGRLVKKDPRVQLNFNAIAQGYTCDIVADLMDSLGVRNYLVEVGMEIVCKGVNASGKEWSIGIDAPVDGSQVAGENIQKVVYLSDCGITTSGNYRKFYVIDGKKFAHSINPVTGYPVQHDLLSATVICNDSVRGGALSDAYATYCMVAGKEKAAELIASRQDLRGYLICDGEVIDLLKDGSEIHTASGHVEEYPWFKSRYMSPRQVLVWLPDGYSPDEKYAVLYMHDGQMLFDSTSTWNGEEWQVDEVLGDLIAEGKVPPAIVVGIAHGDNRYGEYFPEKVLGYLGGTQDSRTGTVSEPSSAGCNSGDVPAGALSADAALDYMLSSGTVYEADEYLRFLVHELKPFIDSHYSTLPDKENTFIAGSSMGGLISLYALCEYPDVFGGAACMSTHLPMIASASYTGATDISRTVFEAFLSYLDDNLPEAGSCLLYTDRGDSTIDALYPPYQARLDSLLTGHGWTPGPSFSTPVSGDHTGYPDSIHTSGTWISPVFPGASHVEHDWATRLHIPLTFLLRHD